MVIYSENTLDHDHTRINVMELARILLLIAVIPAIFSVGLMCYACYDMIVLYPHKLDRLLDERRKRDQSDG
jgi:hypothetical protein